MANQNILNLTRAIKFLGYEAEITHNNQKIINSSHVILPGVGAFENAMKQLEKYNLHNTILEYAKLNKPLLGICLGMQILLTVGYEFGFHSGLGLIKGKVIKISNKKNKEIKIPHVGWNEIYPNNDKKEWKNKILKSSLIGKSFYFVHSFFCRANDTSLILNETTYSSPFTSAIEKNNIFGVQYHPEKSHETGNKVLLNFIKL